MPSPGNGGPAASASRHNAGGAGPSWAPSQVQMVFLVALFGGVGGLIAWVLQESTGGHLFPFRWYAAIPAALLLGAGAAGIGVYVLARTDLRQIGGALFFALLCGVFFRPVWQAGSNFIGGAFAQGKATSAAATVRTATDQLQNFAASATPQQVEAAIQNTSTAATALLQKTADVPNEDARKALSQNSVDAVEAIKLAAPKAPDFAVDSLQNIGTIAKQTGQDNITMHVLDSLRHIETTSQDPRVVQKAKDAAVQVRRPSAM
jgi:hypothetical protein